MMNRSANQIGTYRRCFMAQASGYADTHFTQPACVQAGLYIKVQDWPTSFQASYYSLFAGIAGDTTAGPANTGLYFQHPFTACRFLMDVVITAALVGVPK
jgi:hypothetical protein